MITCIINASIHELLGGYGPYHCKKIIKRDKYIGQRACACIRNEAIQSERRRSRSGIKL